MNTMREVFSRTVDAAIGAWNSSAGPGRSGAVGDGAGQSRHQRA
jgi:hypothetical protein